MARGTHLYIILQHTTGAFKVGRTNDIDRRIKELLTGSPYRLKCILLLKGQGALERQIHFILKSWKSRNSKGEWFDHEGLPSLPDWIYEQLDLDVVNTWWEPENK